ncbi:hypothetical protein DUI87_17453 [Hirundo rustica rustica]|uniref:Uncharacterized protein n=1 Tax=Hirundo rustica rustica TaxID=333673 RepID=A0A3M0JYS8_HIRRU|nr:hypothetical protein DUI87_17453 [Hirundo rustica rustica]
MTGILEQKVGSEPHVEHMGGGDLLDEKENSHEYDSTAKNQQCLDFIPSYSKGNSKANVGHQQGETTVMSSPVLNCSGMGSGLEEGSALCWEAPRSPVRHCSDFVQLCAVLGKDQL